MSAKEEFVRAGPHDTGHEPPESFNRALAVFEAELAELRPAGTDLIDVHTHLGLDEDGRSLDLPTLLGFLDQAGVARGCVFPLHDPDRRPAYSVPNDRVLAWAGESGGRLSPFCRLDPTEDPVGEGERCLAAGAEGIKLHPRAQGFSFDGDGMDGIFALAAEARVPLLIHMGRGMPPVADGLVRVAHRHPDAPLILAHAGIADQNILAAGLADHPAIFYDTSCFSAYDVLDLFARVPAERVLFGSDPPYGRPLTGLYLALRAARAVGCDEEQLKSIGGDGAAGLVARRRPAPGGAPRGARIRPMPGVLMRVFGYGSIAFGAVFAGNFGMAAEMLDLGVACCRDPDPGELGPVLDRLGSALSTAQALLRDPDTGWFGVGLLHLGLSLAATERA